MTDLFPGWYPDPEIEDQQRWWNGIGWVDRVLPKGHSEVQIRPLATPHPAPSTAADPSPDQTAEPDQPVESDPSSHPDNATAASEVAVDLREGAAWFTAPESDPTIDPDQGRAEAEDRSALSRRHLPTAPLFETYVAWDGLSYEGQPPEGWHLASDERWWAPDTGPDTPLPTGDESEPTQEPASIAIAPSTLEIESKPAEFSLPATSYSRLEKLPSAQDTSAHGTKKSSWWKRRKG